MYTLSHTPETPDTRYEYACVAICGAAVLGLEILGTRVLAPFYGSGLYLWTALLVVTLGALAIGYLLGGHWADRGPKRRRLAMLPALAGVWVLLIPVMRHPVLRLAEPFGLRTAVLCSALLLFFAPLMAMGMVGPYAVRIATRDVDRVGRVAGKVWALSTAASVAAALAVGFYLLPAVGVTRLLVSTGAMLVGTGGAGLLGGRRPGAFLSGVALAVGVALPASSWIRETRAPSVLMLQQSPHGEIRVVEHLGARFLLIDGAVHTMVDDASLESLYPYVHVMDLARQFFSEPGRMLLIGLGGGSLAQTYSRHGWEVEAVELDPVVIAAARRFFGLLPTDGIVACADGRRYLKESNRQYDIIAFDAFGSSAIPFHLATLDVFRLASQRLTPGGIVTVNVEALGWDHRLVRAVAATLRRVFPNVRALPTMEPPSALGNVVLMASSRPLDLPEDLPPPESRFSESYHRIHAWDNRFEPGSAMVLTDDRSPIDLWAENINLEARKHLHRYFKEAAQSW